jgi:hypothetical protein
MATLILTTIGSAIGGPAGGAIGAIIGQQVDQAIFAPKAREGARLKELAVQTSSYGTTIPAIFGAMRVAGTVIWATDLIERRVKSGGGKGRQSTINYSYSVSMAVALSSRPVARVGRIWADGNLLRGSAGDLKTDGQFRLVTGHDDQPADPLMASAEASGQCPAHRGIAYAMFEDLQLADYGNRIPSMTFELFEREGAVPVNAIFEVASDGAILGSSSETIAGYALSGADARSGLAALMETLPLELSASDGVLRLDQFGAGSADVSALINVAGENGQQFDPPLTLIEPAEKYPQSLALRYYDLARDYQVGVQQSERGSAGRTARQIELAAVLTAQDARRIVEMQHLQADTARTTWKGQVARSARDIRAGDWISDATGKKWRVEEVETRFGSSAISARAATVWPTGTSGVVAPGRHISSPDVNAGETRIALLDLPILDGTDPGKPLLAVCANGTGRGWRRAALSLVTPTGLIELGSTAAPAIMGTSLNALVPHNPLVIDEAARLDIQLLNSAMDMPERAGSPIDNDAPYCWLGGEFIRFGRCEALGGGAYRLSRLQRACFAADLLAPTHMSGESFALLEVDTARLLEGRSFALGETIDVEALGLGDVSPASASAVVKAMAVTPLPPVHGVAEIAADGAILLNWKRRSRLDLGWRDGVDQILAEDIEHYLVELIVNGTPTAQWTSLTNSLVIAASELAALGVSAGPAISFVVRQIGRFARSDQHFIEIA